MGIDLRRVQRTPEVCMAAVSQNAAAGYFVSGGFLYLFEWWK